MSPRWARGVSIDDQVITIEAAGTYTFRGDLADGHIVVEVGDDDEVTLVLDGVDIECSNFSAIYVANAGGGSLTVTANYDNGIQSKDDLLIDDVDITVTSANDGLKGRDSITTRDADISVEAGGDGIQASNDEDATKGVVVIESGTLDIEADGDGIQAETNLIISGGGSTHSAGSTSTKGLKATSLLTISGGTIEIDSADDAIHSNDELVIDGGEIVISSGDDGIHADTSLEINDGDITINNSYEGIESVEISLNGGNIYVVASDDGVNGAGGSDGSAFADRHGQGTFTTAEPVRSPSQAAIST